MWIDKNYNNGACFGRFTLLGMMKQFEVRNIDDNKDQTEAYHT
jgi:hypothetical protein